MRRILVTVLAATVLVGLLTAGPGAADGRGPGWHGPGWGGPSRNAVVFNGQGNNLDAYESVPPFRHQRVITTRASDPNGLDINAQICFFPGLRNGARWFIAGEDTGQPNPPQGWGIFELRGNRVGKFRAREIGKL